MREHNLRLYKEIWDIILNYPYQFLIIALSVELLQGRGENP